MVIVNNIKPHWPLRPVHLQDPDLLTSLGTNVMLIHFTTNTRRETATGVP